MVAFIWGFLLFRSYSKSPQSGILLICISTCLYGPFCFNLTNPHAIFYYFAASKLSSSHDYHLRTGKYGTSFDLFISLT